MTFENFARSGAKSRNRRTVWKIPVARSKTGHTAVFPSALVKPCIAAGCPRGGLVLDPFAGSGTTLEVAVRMGRDYMGFDLNAEYCAQMRRRMYKFVRLPLRERIRRDRRRNK